MSRNLLDAETSPYLLQHKDNPVHWRPWGKEALEEAGRAGKPLLVSVGYASCHWCHVMAHESFEDPETAALMNELYVCVKVDREERPDLDQIFQTSLNALGHSGGWPLTIFLTPAGETFWGGTYFPKEASASRPAFKSILNSVAELVRGNSETVTENVKQITQIFDRIWNQSRSGGLNTAILNQVAMRMGQRYDIFFGGVTGAPKFPNVQMTEMLWRAYLRTGLLQFLQLTASTLDFMCQGGIHDHVGGGFARYATDENWLTPHFEKMLYDNAQIADILTLVWQQGRQPLYKQRVEETIGWILREMRAGEGAFASSLDADSEGEEGKFYLWSETEIDTALAGTFVQRFKDVYGVTRAGNHKGKNILNRLGSLALLPDADEALFAKQRQLLFAAREQRVRPNRDDKVLTDWNGMTIATLANSGAIFRHTEWTAAAARAFKFICDKMSDGDRLFHTYRSGKHQHPGFSDDYAQMARAGLALWETAGERNGLERAIAWTRVLDQHFWDATFGGYCFTPDDGEAVKVRIRAAIDTATPSANGVMVGVLNRLYMITGEQDYRDRSNLLLQAFAGDLSSSWGQMASYLNNFDFVANSMQVVIIGPIADGRTHALSQAVLGRSLPNRLFTMIEPGENLPSTHPAFGKTMLGGKPTAYVCHNNQCSQPITSPVALSQALMPEVQSAQARPQNRKSRTAS